MKRHIKAHGYLGSHAGSPGQEIRPPLNQISISSLPDSLACSHKSNKEDRLGLGFEEGHLGSEEWPHFGITLQCARSSSFRSVPSKS